MNENLKAAFVAAGAINAGDCLKLHTASADDPALQVAAFKSAHPHLFHAPPPFNARTATTAECDAQLREINRAEAKRQMDAATARTMARLQSDSEKREAMEKERAAAAARQRDGREADRRRRMGRR